MPTLPLDKYGGPARPSGDCGCGVEGPATTVGPSLVPSTDPCDDSGLGNKPVCDDTYQCSVGVRLQPTIDRARRTAAHRTGLRPYRVFLVWQERTRSREWYEVCRKELTPVRIIALDALDLDVSQAGLQPEGGISLREISPTQTNENELRGYLNGEKWGHDDPDREFFYEVQLHQRCADDGTPRMRRFIIGSEPHYDAGAFQFRVGLVDQEIARSPEGEDRTVGDENRVPRLIT